MKFKIGTWPCEPKIGSESPYVIILKLKEYASRIQICKKIVERVGPRGVPIFGALNIKNDILKYKEIVSRIQIYKKIGSNESNRSLGVPKC